MNEQMCKIIRIFCDIANRPHLHTNIFCGGLENKTIQEKKKKLWKRTNKYLEGEAFGHIWNGTRKAGFIYSGSSSDTYTCQV